MDCGSPVFIKGLEMAFGLREATDGSRPPLHSSLKYHAEFLGDYLSG